MKNNEYEEFYVFVSNDGSKYFGLDASYSNYNFFNDNNDSRLKPLKGKSLEGLGVAAINKYELRNANVVLGVPRFNDLELLIGLSRDKLRKLNEEEIKKAGLDKILIEIRE